VVNPYDKKYTLAFLSTKSMLITEIIIMPENFKYELNVTCPIACNLQLNGQFYNYIGH